MKIQILFAAAALALCGMFAVSSSIEAADQNTDRTGQAAFGDWTTDAPGVRRKITVADLPAPFATSSSGNWPRVAAPPAGATLKVPPGFKIEQFASGLENPRLIRVAPNGDIFIAESSSNR